MLITIKLKLKTKYVTKSPRIRFELEQLNDPKIAKVFRAKVGGKFAALYVPESDVHIPANSLKEVLLSTAEKVRRKEKKKIQPWATNEVLNMCDQRRKLKQLRYTSTEVGQGYRKLNREIRKKMKAAKEQWTEEQVKNIENGMMPGNSKEAYNTLEPLTKTQQDKSTVIEDSG